MNFDEIPMISWLGEDCISVADSNLMSEDIMDIDLGSNGPHETDETDKIDETYETDETDKIDETYETDETDKIDETFETDETDKIDETYETDETDKIDETYETDKVDETDEADEELMGLIDELMSIEEGTVFGEVIKAYVGFALHIEFQNITSFCSPSSIALNTINGNQSIEVEYIDEKFLPNENIVVVNLRILDSENNKLLVGEEFNASIWNMGNVSPIKFRLMGCKIEVENLDNTKITQYVNAPTTACYKKIELSIQDTDNEIVNFEAATIEMSLWYADTRDTKYGETERVRPGTPFMINDKAVNVILCGEDYMKIKPALSGCMHLKQFETNSGHFVVNQKLPRNIHSSGVKCITLIKVMVENTVLTAYCGPYLVKTRCDPTAKDDRLNQIFNQTTKGLKASAIATVKDCNTNLDTVVLAAEFAAHAYMVGFREYLKKQCKRARDNDGIDIYTSRKKPSQLQTF